MIDAIKDKLLFIYKFMIRGHKASSESYIKYFKKNWR